jgi:hypothetical protein
MLADDRLSSESTKLPRKLAEDRDTRENPQTGSWQRRYGAGPLPKALDFGATVLESAAQTEISYENKIWQDPLILCHCAETGGYIQTTIPELLK